MSTTRDDIKARFMQFLRGELDNIGKYALSYDLGRAYRSVGATIREAQDIMARMGRPTPGRQEIRAWYHMNTETGETFWTALDNRAAYPQSLGESCLEMLDDQLRHKMVCEFEPLMVLARAVWKYNDIDARAYRDAAHALRRAMWHRRSS